MRKGHARMKAKTFNAVYYYANRPSEGDCCQCAYCLWWFAEWRRTGRRPRREEGPPPSEPLGLLDAATARAGDARLSEWLADFTLAALASCPECNGTGCQVCEDIPF